jgi:hypothetical protein
MCHVGVPCAEGSSTPLYAGLSIDPLWVLRPAYCPCDSVQSPTFKARPGLTAGRWIGWVDRPHLAVCGHAPAGDRQTESCLRQLRPVVFRMATYSEALVGGGRVESEARGNRFEEQENVVEVQEGRDASEHSRQRFLSCSSRRTVPHYRM